MKRSLESLGISAKKTKLIQITDIARHAGIRSDELRVIGSYKAKIALSLHERLKHKPNGKLICVSGMTPTPMGEGKTCTSIGLTQALGVLKKRVLLCLREPSLAPIFGNKGGATGGGYARVLPSDDINLHFTGDIHAVELATNLLAAVIDNHRHHGNALNIDPNAILWRRSLDICDRQLRSITAGMSAACENERSESAFDITPASEIMAILSLSSSIRELKVRLSEIIVAFDKNGRVIRARQLGVVGALAVMLKDAIEPNLVQTLEGQPCIIHTGPFANVSHGNNSVLATQMGLKLADYVITESGFGTDLGLEKFFDLVCPSSNLTPSAVVLVATIKALKSHSATGKFTGGFDNIGKHVQNIRRFGLDTVVCINRFPQDSDHDVESVLDHLKSKHIEAVESRAVEKGGVGAVDLAQALLRLIAKKTQEFKPLYSSELPIEDKCRRIATEIYGARDIELSPEAKKDLAKITSLGLNHLGVNIAKTPLSLSDQASLKGSPKDWRLQISRFRIFAGAGYVIALAGKLMLMPGLPKRPLLEQMDLADDGTVTGVS